ncbi:Six-hairpin glycosidase [Pyrenochaeta sp. DS3sAY3a]|nr:Six-hairpin glycosidase [Pyrenochaeta sp. DS3sAY3a]
MASKASPRRFGAILFLVAIILPFAFAAQLISDVKSQDSPNIQHSAYEANHQHVIHPPALSPSYTTTSPTSPSPSNPSDSPDSSTTETNVLRDLHSALSTLQEQYFSLWVGKWTTSNDWTGAVVGTYVSATLSSLSRSIDYTMPGTFDKARKLDVEAQMVENEINKYFAQSVAYYFGEDHFAIRMQAFDDMLWVVLGWLESVGFIQEHSRTHYAATAESSRGEWYTSSFADAFAHCARGLWAWLKSVGIIRQRSKTHYTEKSEGSRKREWHASQFIDPFAHRARIFYELAEKGWDWRLCGGGMNWNPRLLPYKNAITNELFISASVGMYLNFPGDQICGPFLAKKKEVKTGRMDEECNEPIRGQYDPIYLANAINGYNWLESSGMKNDQGLYTDGFHIGGYRENRSKTTCDERNDMVYTYNQGVILSGLRGLWEATGNLTYLEDGHDLVGNVLRATGWRKPSVFSRPSFTPRQSRKQEQDTLGERNGGRFVWHGLGSNGILTEACDPSGRCSQDGQSFKGIFFHHLTAFCAPLPLRPARLGVTYAASRETATLHRRSCNEYAGWVVHNAQSALKTRDEEGRFGAWWGARYAGVQKDGVPGPTQESNKHESRKNWPYVVPKLPRNAIDYRNLPKLYPNGTSPTTYSQDLSAFLLQSHKAKSKSDLNDRGRGRTVETQGAGVSVVRAMWEFLRHASGDVDLEL